MENLLPREKLLKKGADTLSDDELMSILLGSGIKGCNVFELSKTIVKTIDKSEKRLRIDDLKKIRGMGEARACLVLASNEFFRRRIKPEGIKIANPKHILPLISYLNTKKQEHFVVITLNGANEVINTHILTIGLINRTQIHPREVYFTAIKDRAVSIIIAHNHPSGSLNPSKEDINITEILKKSGELLCINLLDHIIFSSRGYYSFIENGAI